MVRVKCLARCFSCDIEGVLDGVCKTIKKRLFFIVRMFFPSDQLWRLSGPLIRKSPEVALWPPVNHHGEPVIVGRRAESAGSGCQKP